MNLLGLGAVQPGLGRTLWPSVGVGIEGCSPEDRWDTTDTRWVSLSGNADNALHIAFPHTYFKWCQEYLRRRIAQKPSRSASAQERVFYALDVWAHIQYALLALNIPLATSSVRVMTFSFGDVPQPPPSGWRDEISEKMAAAILDFKKYAEMGRLAGIEANKKKFMNDAIRKRIAAQKLGWAPFMSSYIFWQGLPTRLGELINAFDNPIRMLLAEKCIPWMQGGMRLDSKGNKD